MVKNRKSFVIGLLCIRFINHVGIRDIFLAIHFIFQVKHIVKPA